MHRDCVDRNCVVIVEPIRIAVQVPYCGTLSVEEEQCRNRWLLQGS